MSNLSEALELSSKYKHFRILVIGRANAGKTTLLKRVCNTTEEPCIYDERNNNLLEPTASRGIHDIRRPFVFRSNPQLIFHDSPGFESGDMRQLRDVQEFIRERARATEFDEQLHAIWFCLVTDEAGPLLKLEMGFFNEERPGNVPIIAIFTKFDNLIARIYDPELCDDENRVVATRWLVKNMQNPLSASRFPPNAYFCLEEMYDDGGNHQDQVAKLVVQTFHSLGSLSLMINDLELRKPSMSTQLTYLHTVFDHLPMHLLRVSDHQVIHGVELMVAGIEMMIDGGRAGYAILSHRWGMNELTSSQKGRFLPKSIAGNRKLLQLRKWAIEYGCRYAWIDTLCINKQSSIEVEVSIQSMYNWYRGAEVCIVHLAETDNLHNLDDDPWFKRGWTLQELLAPRRLKFLNRNWKPLTADRYDKSPGFDPSKSSLWKKVNTITGIPFNALNNFDPGIQHAPRIFGWATARKTTKPEDIAYCLVSMLSIRLTISYGEGSERASRRLKEKILEQSLPLVRNHVYNRLPIYLLRVSDMKLIRREDMMGPMLDDMVKLDGTTNDQIREATKYAILSHQWGREELTFRDMETGIQLSERGKAHEKLLRFCEKAKEYGCRYAWIDTACINKQSSAELEESIRSMFNWYRDAELCIVHLAATDTIQDLNGDGWFTRGWTLQELLAPEKLKFFNSQWEPLTNDQYDKFPGFDPFKSTLWESIHNITGIPLATFKGFIPGIHQARQGLGWVSRRQTTRSEDIAYCLIGILDVKLTIAYGEGEDSAFHRLQEAILQRNGDRGIFLWTGGGSLQNSMLASHPSCFCPAVWKDAVNAFLFGDELKDPTIVFTSYGLGITLSIYDAQFRKESSKYRLGVEGLKDALVQLNKGADLDKLAKLKVGILGSAKVERRDTLFAILLERDGDHSPAQYRRIATRNLIQFPCPENFECRLVRVYII